MKQEIYKVVAEDIQLAEIIIKGKGQLQDRTCCSRKDLFDIEPVNRVIFHDGRSIIKME